MWATIIDFWSYAGVRLLKQLNSKKPILEEVERILLALKILRQADPTKPSIRFIGDTNSEKDLERIVLDKINQNKQKRKIRTDAVYCVEILLTA